MNARDASTKHRNNPAFSQELSECSRSYASMFPQKQELSWEDEGHIWLHAMPCISGIRAVKVSNPRLGWQPEETPGALRSQFAQPHLPALLPKCCKQEQDTS
jgi:hypothetical protein